MSDLLNLPNVGKVTEKLLIQSGINTEQQLREIGAEEAFFKIRMIDPTACLHTLYGIQGAIDGVKDNYLTKETKENLKIFYKTL